MRHVFALCALLAVAAAAGKNLIGNGSIGSGDGWSRMQGTATVRFEVDRKRGAEDAGSLHIAKTDAEDTAAHNWRTRFDVSGPGRLKLTVMAKTEGMAADAVANVMVQLYPAEGSPVGYAWCGGVTGDEDWHEIAAVFDVPPECTHVMVLAYLVGQGRVWFDDFAATATEEPVTPPPASRRRRPKDDPMWKLVRSAAEEIPWLFDAATARARAAREKRPILLYVRCVDDRDAFASAQETLRAEAVAWTDDGLKKDVLFRAGPLSEPAVTDLVTRRFVPLLLTYHLATHGNTGANHSPSDPKGGADPLGEFGLKATAIVTPALVAVDPGGGVLAKLHRIGTMPTDLVDLWLREAARMSPSHATRPEELLADGALDRAAKVSGSSPKVRLIRARALVRLGDLDAAAAAVKDLTSEDAALVRGAIALRRGAWEEGLEAFTTAGDAEEARFFRAWCLHRLGRQAEAEEAWTAMAGPTRFGRRAAACVLPFGPRLWLSHSERLWPRTRALPEETEGYADGFDGAVSVRALLELQREDGSFGGHDGKTGYGYNDGAITALASEALALWGPNLPRDLGMQAAAARGRALAFLEAWARRSTPAGNAFNNPYVLLELVRAARKDAAQEVVVRIGKSQLADGNWTVYQAERPASFNTALNVLALVRAREAGLTLPDGTLARGVAALAAMRQAGDLFPYSTLRGHEWMTTEHGSIARDPLCEHALLACDAGDIAKLAAALERFVRFAPELRVPTKKYYDYFNARGHGGYYFFFAHRNAFEAAALVDGATRDRVRAFVRECVLAAREGDGTFMDHQMIGRAYATAQALAILAPGE